MEYEADHRHGVGLSYAHGLGCRGHGQEFLVGWRDRPEPAGSLTTQSGRWGESLPRTGAAIGYQNALDMLDRGDLISAINAFARMGQYESAPQYTAYLEAKLHLLRNNPRKALEGFGKLGDFLDSRALAACGPGPPWPPLSAGGAVRLCGRGGQGDHSAAV